MTSLPLSVAIITCNRPALCSALLAILSPQLTPGDELLLVDDGAATPTDLPDGITIQRTGGGRGAGGARNVAASVASNSWVVFLDDDVVPPADFIARLRHALAIDDLDVLTFNVRCHPDCGETGILFDERYPLSRGPDVVTYTGTTGTRHSPNDVWRVGVGAAMAWRTEVLRCIGGFAEAIGQGRQYGGGEDLAAFRTALQRGNTIRYDGTIVVHHLSPLSLGELRAKMRGYAIAAGALASHVWLTDRDAGMLSHLLRDIARTPLTFAIESWRAAFRQHHLPLAPLAAFPWWAARGLLGHARAHTRHPSHSRKPRSPLWHP